ncbi:MAG: hypothetical protein AAF304_04340 [Pseudomonadota bacterium]
METKSNIILNPVLWLVIALTLGLAPFVPEPHIWEKLKWILSGAEGMKAIDWFDFFMHGTPWIMLVISLSQKLKKH